MLGHMHDRLARFMVLRGAGLTQQYTHEHIVAALRARDDASARQAMSREITESAPTRSWIAIIRTEGAGWLLGA